MESGDSKRALIVGIFISLGIVIFVLGVFTLGSSQKTFGGGIQISATFDDVNGLKKGNGVWFSGVRVGTVDELKFVGISQVNVKMTIDKESQPYVHNNAGLKLGADGLIGNKIIQIEGGSPNAPVVKNGDVLQAVKAMSTDDIMKTLQQNNVNILAITNDLKKATKEIADGKGLVGKLMGDTALAQKFASIVQNLDNTTRSASQMAGQLSQFGNKLNRKGTLTDKLLTDTSTYSKLQASVANLQKTSVSASEFIENLNQTSQKMNGTNSIIGVLLNDPTKAKQMQNTLDYLHQSVYNLNEDLKAAQGNFLIRGYFKKKAKAQEDSLKRVNGSK